MRGSLFQNRIRAHLGFGLGGSDRMPTILAPLGAGCIGDGTAHLAGEAQRCIAAAYEAANAARHQQPCRQDCGAPEWSATGVHLLMHLLTVVRS